MIANADKLKRKAVNAKNPLAVQQIAGEANAL
jgi:hypothetical protein